MRNPHEDAAVKHSHPDAVLAGASSFAAITGWLHDLDDSARARLGFDSVAPAGTTVSRLLIPLDAGLLTTVLATWLRRHPTALNDPSSASTGRRRHADEHQ